MTVRMHVALWLALAVTPLIAAGCVPNLCEEVEALPGGPLAEPASEPTHLAIGDSILASNKAPCQAISCHAGLALGTWFESHAVGGRPLTSDSGGPDIASQYESGPWEWVVVDGGANDLRLECGCTQAGHDVAACEAAVDELAGVTGAGEMRALIDLIEDDPAHDGQIALLGYYPLDVSEGVGWGGCVPYIVELSARYELLAADDERVHFVDPTPVMDPAAFPERFAIDGVHPSPAGSEAIGQLVASVISGDG